MATNYGYTSPHTNNPAHPDFFTQSQKKPADNYDYTGPHITNPANHNFVPAHQQKPANNTPNSNNSNSTPKQNTTNSKPKAQSNSKPKAQSKPKAKSEDQKIYEQTVKDLQQSKKEQEERYAAAQAAEEARIRAQAEFQIGQYNAQRPVLEQDFTDNAQDSYVSKMMAQKEMPQVLSSRGLNGGVTDIAKIGINTSYDDMYSRQKKTYDANLRELQNQIDAIMFGLSDSLTQSANKYDSMLANSNASYEEALRDLERAKNR